MTKEQLIAILNSIQKTSKGDPEAAHAEADNALLAYINDEDIEEAYNDIDMWYA